MPRRPARFALPLLLSVLTAGACAVRHAAAAAESRVPREVRGVWVVRTDLTSPAAVSRVVQYAKSNGLNTLFVQCRGRGDAYYRSDLEPRAESLAKQPASFDPLAQAVREAHAAGLKVHAWVNSCYVWSDPKAPKSPDHIANAHKDWLAVSSTGRRCTIGDPQVFICPGNLEAREHLVDVCADLARRYDLDGLQLDYIRYSGKQFCYCDGCLDRFAEYLRSKGTPSAKIAAARAKGRTGLARAFAWTWGQFRRGQVTSLVRSIGTAVKAKRRDLIVSADVIPWGRFPADFKHSEAYNLVGQDWYTWMSTGLVDAVCPMTYQPGLPGFKSWVNGVQQDHPSFPVWYGIGAYLFGPESAAQKVKAVRQAGGQGWILFSYTSCTHGGRDDAYLRALKGQVIPNETASR